MQFFFQILLIIFLIFINGYFVASELALVSIRRTRIEELVRKGNKTARKIHKALKHIDLFISATQFGITVISILLGWLGEPILADILQKVFFPHITTLVSHTLAVIIGFVLITFFDILLGEIVPKNIALQKTERIAFITITPLLVFTKIFLPIISLLTYCSTLILKIFGLSNTLKKPLTHSEEEIKIILSQSAQSGAIERGEAEMVYKVFKIADLPVENIMIERKHIVAFDISQKIVMVREELKKNSHSRFPVYHATLDHVIGFVHVKDIYKFDLNKYENDRIKDTAIVREIIRIPPTKRVDDLILEMRRKRIHLALVVDKKDKTLGIVTLEDLLESIVGDIEDEFERPVFTLH